MADLDKVIKGMEICISPDECSHDTCPYYDRPDNASGLCWDRLMTDALALLKEQEAKTGKWIEQDGYDGDVYYDCSVCGESWVTIEGTPQENRMRYCPHCRAKMDDEVESW